MDATVGWVEDDPPGPPFDQADAGPDQAADQPADQAADQPADQAADDQPGDQADPDQADSDQSLRFDRWRKRSAAGVMMSGIALGLQEALTLPRQDPPFVIQASGEPDAEGPIDLQFDPDDPSSTVAVIRPWLADPKTDRTGPEEAPGETPL
jgi:hypothetical protein